MAKAARLAKRADFVAARKGRRVESRCFTLQAARRAPEVCVTARVGFTITKKVGGAVERNRIRRRFREILRRTDEIPLQSACDYVLVARREALTEPFAELRLAVTRAVAATHMQKYVREKPGRNAASPDRPSR